MVIGNFDLETFTKDLSTQATDLIPEDLSQNHKDFISEIVFKFSHLAGSALKEDPSLNFNDEQVCIVVQFIAEWTFHKAIDICRANIPDDFKESVLQKIAFTIFEIAKQCLLKQIPHDQIILVVEAQVKKAYENAITDLKKRKIILEEVYESALKQSNIDKMAKEIRDEKLGIDMTDLKVLKHACFAVFLKTLPDDYKNKLLSKFDQRSYNIINDFLKMPDLESHVNNEFLQKSLEELKNTCFIKKQKVTKKTPKKVKKAKKMEIKSMDNVIKSMDKEKLINVIENERQNVKILIQNIYEDKPFTLPKNVENVILKHISEKLP